MSGPDFEMPSIVPPERPANPPIPLRPKRPGAGLVRAGTLAAVLGFSGVAVAEWPGDQGTRPPTTVGATSTSISQTTTTPSTSTSSTVGTTTTTRGPAVTRACVDSTESPEASNGWAPDGYPWITFHVSPRAAREAIVRIARDASEARRVLGDAGALGVRIYCTVQELATASNRAPDEVQRAVTAGQVAYMSRGDVWVYGPSFQERSASSQRQAVYHEYFHALQRSLSRTRSTRPDSEPPLWLIEGSARFFENAVTPRELEDFRRAQVRRWQAKPALEEVEATGAAPSVGGNGDAYTVGAVAVDYLATRFGRDRIQTQFWVALADTDWQSAFLQVFGVSVDTFYSEFAAYRQTLRP